MTIINRKPVPVPPIIVDFGWYFGTQREPPYHYTSNGEQFPPGFTILNGTFNTATSYPTTINVVSTASFDLDTPDQVMINDGIEWALLSYAATTPTSFTGVEFISGDSARTFNTTTDIWSPRFYVDSLPLQTNVTFDAQDTQNMGLPVTSSTGHHIIEWRWDFGNGTHGFGPVSETIYPFNQPAPSVNVTLTVTDSFNREYSCAHPLTLIGSSSFQSQGGSSTREGG